MIYVCGSDKRRAAVEGHGTLNGIDYIEVLDREAPADSPRQQTLLIFFLNPLAAGTLIEPDQIVIEGGVRFPTVQVEWTMRGDNLDNSKLSAAEQTYFQNLPDPDHILLVRTDSSGDFSTYVLRLRSSASGEDPPTNFDPQLSHVSVRFKVECPSDFDCQQPVACPVEPLDEPDLDYLAKDYASFRQLILDRMSRLLPGWDGRSPADVGVTLAELIAYEGDRLSYWQDAIATEAYLHTARRRTSLRRHALLVDYRIGEGRNARSWMYVPVRQGPFDLPQDVQFASRVAELSLPDHGRVAPASKEHATITREGALIYEPLMHPVLHPDHNALEFYTWGEEDCCLPRAATSATLTGRHNSLQKGQYLLFEETVSPTTGVVEDADPQHRQVVRLKKVTSAKDPLTNTDVTEIEWDKADALSFSLCISSPEAVEKGHDFVSIARGNMVLADHGATIEEAIETEVPGPWLFYPASKSGSKGEKQATHVEPRYRPGLARRPLTHGVTNHPLNSAALMLAPPMREVAPWVTSLEDSDGELWSIRPDLLSSSSNDRHFVVEVEGQEATLRFGDGQQGMRPVPGLTFTAHYRVGNGRAGMAGADSFAHVISTDGRIAGVRNPIPTRGGLEPETRAQIKRRVPQAFRRQERAVTLRDYEEKAGEDEDVQRASADLRWTGSWHTHTLTVDRVGGALLDDEAEKNLFKRLERYRMAGHDLNFKDPLWVSLQLELDVCVAHDYFRSDVTEALLERFTAGFDADGEPGIFHPDRFTFGQTIYLSPFVALARQVQGVDSVRVLRFSRLGDNDLEPLTSGRIELGRREIARLDNDPNFPEHGHLTLHVSGGK